MQAVSATELSRMRSAAQGLMPTACTVRNKGAASDDSAGGTTYGAPTDTVTVCRIAPSGGRELEIAGKLTQQVSYTVRLPHGTTVSNTSQILIESTTYHVIAVMGGGSYATAVTALCTEAA